MNFEDLEYTIISVDLMETNSGYILKIDNFLTSREYHFPKYLNIDMSKENYIIEYL